MRIIKEESLIRKADIAQSPFQRDSRKHMFSNSNLFSSNHHCLALIYVTLVVEDINSVKASVVDVDFGTNADVDIDVHVYFDISYPSFGN